MRKGDKCEYCGELLIPGGIVFEYEGQTFRFCDIECFEQWIKSKLLPFIRSDYNMEEYNEN